MKKFSLLLTVMFLVVLTGTIASGQTPFYDGFTGTGNIGGSGAVGDTSNGWTTHSGTVGTIDILSGSLSYPGLQASTGGRVHVIGNNTLLTRDVNAPLSLASPTVAYFSALVNVIDNTQLGTTGDYFIHFGQSAGATNTIFAGRLGIKSVNAGANFRFAIQNTSGGTPTYTDFPTDLNFGTTYLVVVKVDVSVSPIVATLWVNPSSLGGSEPPGGVTNNSGTGGFTTFASICIRNGAGTPKADYDEIRAGLTWADVTPAAGGGPLTGTKTIPGDFATIKMAVDTLNFWGVGSGGVTFNVAAGYAETAPDSGYVITASGTAPNQIKFQKSGSGANPTITASASLPIGALNDAIIKIIGGDYITIDGFTLQENPANTITTPGTNNMTEFGVGLFYASPTDGAKNNTIKNCTITLNRTYANTFGIYSNVTHSASDVIALADITSPGGSNSNLTISGNTISNVNIGICVVGSLVGANMDTGLSIDGLNGNIITDFGTSGTFSAYRSVNQSVNGIYLNNQLDCNVTGNSITSSDGGMTSGTLRGVYVQTTGTLPATGTFTRTISANTISLRSGIAAGAILGIAHEGGNANTSLVISDNTFKNTTHTVSASGSITFISNTGATLNQTINTNAFGESGVGLSVNTTGSVTFISNSVSLPAGGTQNVNGNTILTSFTKTGAGGTITFFTSNASSVAGSVVHNDNNNFSNINVTGATTIAGWSNTDGGSPTKFVNGNTFNNITGGTGTITIINLNFGENNAANNVISNVTGGSTITGIARGTSGAVNSNNISNNIISGLSTTGASTVTGISIGGTTGTINNVFKNKIYNLQADNAAGVVYGMTVSSGTTNNVYNNLIGDLRAPSTSSTTDAVRGINLTSATATSTLNLYYNTVYLNATSTGTNFSTSALFHTTNATATTAAMSLVNNVLVNTSTANGTGITSAYRRSSTALTNYASSSNNNLFYAGTPGAANVIFYDGTNSDQTLAAFKTRVAPREGLSVTENPPFLSTSGSDATFLHINPAIPTRLESGGTPIAGITTDYDGDTRSTTTPDIGADEFSGIAIDEFPPTITYTPLGNTGTTGARTLTATITDISGVPTSGIGLPVSYWKIGGAGTYSGATASSLGGNQYEFTFGAGANVGDTVFYYVAAQDAATPPNVGVQPSAGASGFTANPPAAAIPPASPNYYIVTNPPLSGDYTVGLVMFNKISGKHLTFERSVRRVMKEVFVEAPLQVTVAKKGDPVLADAESQSFHPAGHTELREVEEVIWVPMENGKPYTGSMRMTREDNPRAEWPSHVMGVYPTITAAFADLNLRGVSGNTNFLLTDATYPTETYPLIVNVASASLPGSASVVTLKPATGVTAAISGAAPGTQILKILNSYVNIDGSNSGGSTRDLTIENTSTTTPQVIVIGSVGTTPITNCSVKNCNIINGINSSSAFIVSDGTAPGTAGWFNNITIQNNSIQKAYIANYNIAVVSPGNGSGLSILGNSFSTSGANSVRLVGVYAQGIDGATVSGNTIGNIVNTTDASNITGIWFATGTRNSTIAGNSIAGMSGSSGGPRGIAVSSGTTNSNILVSGNSVSAITTSSTSQSYGIYIFSAMSGVVAERNKVSTIYNTNAGGYGARAIHINTGLAASNVTIANNFVWDVKATADNATTYWGIGIGVEGTTGGVNVYYNSVNLYGAMAGYASGSGTIHTAFGVLTSTAGPLDIRNNIFVNTFNNLNQTTDKSYAINSQAANTAFTSINNNDYLAGDSAGVLGFLGADQATLAAWRTATGQDLASVSGTPFFMDSTNLHIDSTQTPSVISNAGTPIAGITIDIDGQTRHATTPDIGADEFGAPVVTPPPTISSVARAVRVPLQGDSLVVTCTIVDSAGVTAANLLFMSDSIAQTPVAMTRTSGTPQNGTYSGVIPGSANLNGKRIEYQVQATSPGGTTTTSVVAANSYFAGVSPLSPTGVRSIDANLAIRYRNYYARLTGTINGPNFQAANLSQYFQDGVGGMNLFMSGNLGAVRNLGDSIMVVGRLDQFRGVIEVIPDSAGNIQTLATGRSIPVISLTVPQYNADPEAYESRLVWFTNLNRKYPGVPPWPPAATQAAIVMYQVNQTDTVTMFINAGTNIPGSPEPSYPINLTCIAIQFASSGAATQGGYEVLPRYLTDIESVTSGLAGNYTVGSGGAFPTLDSAFSALRIQGVIGPVTLTLTDTAYAAPSNSNGQSVTPAAKVPNLQLETTIQPKPVFDHPDTVGQLTLQGPIAGTSSVNRITIRPADGSSVRITGNGTSVLRLLDASYVTIDGIGLTGATRLTINSTAAGSAAIQIEGNSDNNIVRNVTVRSPFATGTGIFLTAGTSTTPDSNLVTGNAIPTSADGIVVIGNASVFPSANIISNNLIGSVTDSIGETGIYVQQGVNTLISGNTIQNVRQGAATYNVAGIWIATKHLKTRVWNNVIKNVRVDGAASAVFAAGVYYFGTAGDTTRALFYNNMVYGLENVSTSASATIRGLYCSTGIQDTVVYNSVYITGTSAGTMLASAINTGSPVQLALRNNLAINTRLASGTGRSMGLYMLSTTTVFTSNYNDLYVPVQAGSHVAAITTTNYTTLSAWQATNRDQNSISVMPNFQAPDLHINPNIPTPINGGGTPIAGITTDIDGSPRNPTTPDIGADEFSVGFFDDFEAYTVGQRLACQNPADWTTWDNLPCDATEDPMISNAFAFSGTKSVVIVQNNDLVRKHGNDTTGIHVITFKFYVPSGKAGYFNTLATYSLPSTFNWGMEVYFDSAATGNNGRLFAGSSTAFPFSYTHNQWQTVRVVVNLNIDSARFAINGNTVRTWRWTAGASGGGSPRRLAANDFYGATAWDQMYVDDYDYHPDTIWTGVKEIPVDLPQTFSLLQNYPNPFNPTTTLGYTLPKDAHVTLSVYNVLGQRVATLRDEVQYVGYHTLLWDGTNDFGSKVASGIYFYRIEAKPADGSAAFSSIKKMVLLK